MQREGEGRGWGASVSWILVFFWVVGLAGHWPGGLGVASNFQGLGFRGLGFRLRA